MTQSKKTAAIDWEHDSLLTRREAATLLRVSQSSLSRWARTGLGPPVIWVTPHAARYLRSDVEAWISRNRSMLP